MIGLLEDIIDGLAGNIAALIVGGIGLVFALVGGGFLWGSYSAGQQADQIAGLSPLSAAEVEAQPDGAAAVVEGRISERNQARLNGVVIYIRERYDGESCDDDGCESIWTEDERVTPALWLDVRDSRVRVSNSDYALQNEPEVWQTTSELIADETRKYRGFRMGSPVFAAGVIDRRDGATLRADFLFGGSQADYLAYQREQAGLMVIFGAIFGGIGLILLIVGVLIATLS